MGAVGPQFGARGDRVRRPDGALQRFLTDARWDDELVIGRLQAYLGPRLSHPQATWVLNGSDVPKQGLKSVGVARQYCGILGKIANCQAGLFLAHVGPQGRALVDKRLYLPAAYVPAAQRRYRAKTDLALEMLGQAQARGQLGAPWVAADAAFGMSPSFREGVAAAGLRYVLDVSPQMTVWPLAPTWTDPPCQGFGRPRRPTLRRGQRRTVTARSLALPPDAWQELTVAQGAQGPRTYRFSAERVRATARGQPGAQVWVVHRQNLDGNEPRHYLSNAPPATPPACWRQPCCCRPTTQASDAEAKARADFDIRWKVALGIEIEERPFAKSTLQLFRAQLILHDQVRAVFEQSLRLARETGCLPQRGMRVALDTTCILGRSAVKDTCNLLGDGIVQLLRALAAVDQVPVPQWAAAHGTSGAWAAA